ncbi:MAG: hypothetical protein ACJZ5A_05345 [Candidatus Thalassarchaeaceae archaeon]|jgi:hypothetical protein
MSAILKFLFDSSKESGEIDPIWKYILIIEISFYSLFAIILILAP